MDWQDRKADEAWLRLLRHEVMVAFAARAALRVVPFTMAPRRFERLTFLTLRASLVSGVAGTWPTPAMRRAAARAAARADDYAFNPHAAHAATAAAAYAAGRADDYAAAAYSAYTATRAAATDDSAGADFVAAADAATDAAMDADKARIDQGLKNAAELFKAPLWPGGTMPAEIAQAWQDFQTTTPDQPWGFWKRWYQSMLHGQPMDWELQKRITLIDPKIWDQGPEAVAKQIAEIEDQYQAELDDAADADPGQTNQLVTRVQRAVSDHPEEIEAYLASLKQLIEDKIAEVESRIPNPDEALKEWERWMDFLRRLWATVDALERQMQRLRENHYDAKPVAIESLSLVNKFRVEINDWPHENAGEIVDGSYRVVLVGLCMGLGSVFSVPLGIAATVGGIAFGGPKLGKIIVDSAKALGS